MTDKLIFIVRTFNPRIWEHYLSVFCKTAETFCFLPMHWDDWRNTVTTSISSTREKLWKIFFTYYVLDSCYQLSTLLTLTQHYLTFDDTMKFLSHSLSRIASGVMISGLILKHDDAYNLYSRLHYFHLKHKGRLFNFFIKICCLCLKIE